MRKLQVGTILCHDLVTYMAFSTLVSSKPLGSQPLEAPKSYMKAAQNYSRLFECKLFHDADIRIYDERIMESRRSGSQRMGSASGRRATSNHGPGLGLARRTAWRC